MPIEFVIVLVTLLLIGSTWLLLPARGQAEERGHECARLVGLVLAVGVGVYLVVALL